MPRRPGQVPPEFALRQTSAPITLLIRKHCPLCLEAKRIIDHSARRYRLAVEVIDIEEEDPAIRERYKDDVPVVLVDGKRRFRGHVNQALLEKALAARQV